MTSIRALTIALEAPSAAAQALQRIFGWEIESDYGAFAALRLPAGIPLWINRPAAGEPTTQGLVIHLASDDVDADFAAATGRGAREVRPPTDMDFGERSACVRVDEVSGVTIDLSRPLDAR
ncbi:VOC family protein [Brachybacterium phenoliresistens]|uniref:VOC family protein n=1 Tax=Brachybacterium phenoliresistens TaxID=396014 RepID=UPI0031D878CC